MNNTREHNHLKKKKLIELEDCNRQSAGKNRWMEYLKGQKITRKDAILAKCCQCTDYFKYGREECETVVCPLYPFRAYKNDFDAWCKKDHAERMKKEELEKRKWELNKLKDEDLDLL